MRRTCLSWVLSLSLVLAQHGAVLHELSHMGAAHQGPTLRADLAAGDASGCPTCQAFAQVANPAAATPSSLAVCPATFIPTPDPCYAPSSAETPTPRSRGPPSA